MISIRRSFLWVLLGPIAILAPYLIAWLVRDTVSRAAPTLVAIGLFAWWRMWAYYRVVRRTGRLHEIDWWVFNFSLYLPLILFVTSGDVRLGVVVYPLALATYVVVLAGYLSWQVLLWWAGASINGGKLLFMLLIAPLHLIAFTVPMLAALGVAAQLVAAGTVGLAVQHYYPDGNIWRMSAREKV